MRWKGRCHLFEEMIPDTGTHWGSVTRTLHWLMAVLILAMFVLGWTAVNYPMSPTKLDLFIWHKSIGLTLFALVVIRILWRLANETPSPPSGISTGEHKLARMGHMSLYLLMVLMPVSGYVVNSTANFPFRYFGGLRVPNLIPTDKAWQNVAENIHLATSWILALVVLLHVLAALRHHFIRKNDVLSNMLTGAGNRG